MSDFLFLYVKVLDSTLLSGFLRCIISMTQIDVLLSARRVALFTLSYALCGKHVENFIGKCFCLLVFLYTFASQ